MKSENKRVIAFYVLAALSASGGYFLLPLLLLGVEMSLLTYYLLNAVQQIFLYIIPALLILRARDARWQRFLSLLRPLSLETAGCCMLLSVASAVVVLLVVVLWQPIVEGMLSYVPGDLPLPKPETALQWTTALVGVAVVPAVAEELFFRGFLQTAVSKYFPRGAVWGVALVFAALHLDISALPGLFLLGCLLGKIMEKRGIAASVLFHLLYNAVVLLLSVKNVGITEPAIWLSLAAFLFCVRRLMREEDQHAPDGTGM